MKRDKKGRFAGKGDDNRGYKFTITFPSIRNIIFWVLIIIIVSPWTLIFERSNLLQKLLYFFENILILKEESESSKKIRIILLNNLVDIYFKYISLNFQTSKFILIILNLFDFIKICPFFLIFRIFSF